MTPADFVIANHESAHAVAALMLGFRVNVVIADRHALIDAAGETHHHVSPDDPRTDAQRAADAAVVTLTAVLVEPGGPGASDWDVARAFRLAEVAGVDPDEFVDAASARARDLIATGTFRKAYDAMSALALEERAVVAPDLDGLLGR